MNENISGTIDGHVAVLKFHNPPSNFATVGLLSALADELEELDTHNEVRAIVLAAEGKVFCAGADLVSPNGFGAEGDDPLREFYDQVLRLFATRKPVVAAVQGAAIGAGLGLAVFADFRVAAPEARFSANFTKLGFHPGFGLTLTLPRLIGAQRAAQMFLTSARYKAGQVQDWGLIDRMATSAETVVDAAVKFASEIAENAPLGLLATRATLRSNLLEEVRQQLAHEHQEQLKLQGTEDFAEGVKAVSERRPGNFKGR